MGVKLINVGRRYPVVTFERTIILILLLIKGLGVNLCAQDPIPLDENCLCNVGNQRVIVRPDGSFLLRNISLFRTQDSGLLPELFRVRAACFREGQAITGQSEFFDLRPGQTAFVAEVFPTQLDPIPRSIRMSKSARNIFFGGTVQLSVTAFFNDGSTQDVTSRSSGTSYRSSIPNLLSISEEGEISLIEIPRYLRNVRFFAVNEGNIATISIRVERGTVDDMDLDGMPNEFEDLYGLNKFGSFDASQDRDRDSLSNLTEFNLGTLPNRRDTDADGIRDDLDGAPLIPEEEPPILTIISPIGGETVLDSETVHFSVTASDNVLISTVVLSTDSAFSQTFTSGQFQANLPIPKGVNQVVFTATATDVAGNIGNAEAVTLNVLPDPPPNIVITSPAPGDEAIEEDPVILSAEASDNDRVVLVEFSTDTGFFVSDFIQPFSAEFMVPSGISSLTVSALAVDNEGNQTHADPITVPVVADPPPVITIVSPAIGEEIAERTVIRILVDLVDNGDINRVDFSADNGFFESITSPPFYPLITVPLGIEEMTVNATATDDVGNITIADPVTFAVIPDTSPEVEFFDELIDGITVLEGSVVFVRALVSDNDLHGLKTVDFLRDGEVVFSRLSSPNPSPWVTKAGVSGIIRVPVGAEEVTVDVQAVDIIDQASNIDSTSFSIVANGAPFFVIASPKEGDSVIEGSELSVSVEPINDLSIRFVVYATDHEEVVQAGFDAAPVYEATLNVPVGISQLTIQASAFTANEFDYENPRVALPVTLNVIPDPPPIVQIVEPLEDTPMVHGSIVFMKAFGDDNILFKEMRFFREGELVFSDAPFSGLPSHITGTAVAAIMPLPLSGTETTLGAQSVDSLDQLSPLVTIDLPLIPNTNPLFTILHPTGGNAVIEGSTITVTVQPIIDPQVDQIIYATSEGDIEAVFSGTEFETTFSIPTGISEFTIQASAFGVDALDTGLPLGTALPVTIDVVPMPRTTINGIVVDELGIPLEGAAVKVKGLSRLSGVDGIFSIIDVPVGFGELLVLTATWTNINGFQLVGGLTNLPAIENGVTEVGAIIIQASALYTTTSEDNQLRQINAFDSTTISSVPISLANETVDIIEANGLATNPLTNKLWTLLTIRDTIGDELVILNPITGEATSIGNTGERFGSLAFDAAGILYASKPQYFNRGSRALYTLSTIDATPTFICSLSETSPIQSLISKPVKKIPKPGVGPPPGPSLITFNPADNALYFAFGSNGFQRIDDIGGDPCGAISIPLSNQISVARASTYWAFEGFFLISGDSTMYRLTSNGTVTEIGNLDHSPNGLAFIKHVP